MPGYMKKKKGPMLDKNKKKGAMMGGMKKKNGAMMDKMKKKKKK